MKDIPYFELSGSRGEIGADYGELLRDKISDTWSFYRNIIRADQSLIKEIAENYQSYIQKSFPELLTEMEGISIGSGLDLWKIVALNSRTELIRTINTQLANECTAVYSAKSKIFAQTWDWAEALENLMVVLKVKLPSGLEVLTLTEPGILGKIGVNSAGVCVGLNILKAPAKLDGIPIHVILRAGLEAQNKDEVKHLLKSHKFGTTSSITFLFADCVPYGVEILGDKVLEFTKNDGRSFVRTNHYLTCDKPNEWEKGPDMESSVGRFHQATRLLESFEEQNIDQLKSILVDDDGENSICHTYKSDDIIESEGTVCRIILDPNSKSMEIARSVDGEYQRFSF